MKDEDKIETLNNLMVGFELVECGDACENGCGCVSSGIPCDFCASFGKVLGIERFNHKLIRKPCWVDVVSFDKLQVGDRVRYKFINLIDLEVNYVTPSFIVCDTDHLIWSTHNLQVLKPAIGSKR